MVVLARPAERALTRTLSRLLVRLLALLATAALALTAIGAYDQRVGEQEVLAVTAFQDRLRPIAEGVFDEVQPLIEAERQAEDDANGGFAVYVDVARTASSRQALLAQRAALEALDAPRTLAAVAEGLERGLRRLTEAVDLYAALPFEQTTDDVDLGVARREAAARLREGLAAWTPAVDALYAQDAPAVPRDGLAPARRPVSQAAYLLAAGRACGRADASVEGDQAEPTDAASARRTAVQEARMVRLLVRSLLAVPAPAADRDRLEREVRTPLRAYGQVAQVLDGLAAGGADGEALFRELVAADADVARVAGGLGDYGSRTCALFLGS